MNTISCPRDCSRRASAVIGFRCPDSGMLTNPSFMVSPFVVNFIAGRRATCVEREIRPGRRVVTEEELRYAKGRADRRIAGWSKADRLSKKIRPTKGLSAAISD